MEKEIPFPFDFNHSLGCVYPTLYIIRLLRCVYHFSLLICYPSSLNYLIDPTFTNANRLFVLSFENEDDINSFLKYYVPKVEIKDFHVLIDRNPFFEIPVKNKEKAWKQIIEMSKNNDYQTGNLLDYEYFKDHYQLIAIDLSKQIELENLDLKQQILLEALKK